MALESCTAAGAWSRRWPARVPAREAEVVRQIDHPNIVALHEVGWIDGDRPYLVMERLDG